MMCIQSTKILALAIFGFLGIFFHLPLFFGVDFLFSSIFSLIILALYGVKKAFLAAVIINSYTIILWGHPFAWLIFSLEILFTGIIKAKIKRDLFLCNCLFWITLGGPISYILYRFALQVDHLTAYLIMLKQSCNGILNALIANIILIFTASIIKKQTIVSYTFKEFLFSVILTLVSLPLLITMILDGRDYMQQTQATITNEMKNLSQDIEKHMSSWFQQHLFAVNHLATRTTNNLSNGEYQSLQHMTRITKELFPDFHNMYIANSFGTTVAFYPPLNKKGESTLGLNFSDREYYKKLKKTREPVISNVFQGRGGVFSPIVTISSPIIKDHKFIGYALAALNLKNINSLMHQYTKKGLFILTLTDQHDKMITSTLSGITPLENYSIEKLYQVQKISDDLSKTIAKELSTAKIKRHKGAYYVFESKISLLEWNLIIEYPVSMQQNKLFKGYIRYFSIAICLLLASILLVTLISKKLSIPLIELAAATSSISKTVNRKKLKLPLLSKSIKEIRLLIQNFNEMANAIDLNFEALVKSEEKYSLAMDATTDGVWDWNLRSQTINYSPSWLKILCEDNLSSKFEYWGNKIHPDDKELFFSSLHDHLHGHRNKWENEHRLLSCAGKWVWVIGRGKVVERNSDGRPLRMVGTIIDISERKKSEEIIRKSEKKFQTIFQNTPAGILISTLKNGRILNLNKSMCDIIGFTRGEAIGRTAIEIGFWPTPEDRIKTISILKKNGHFKNLEFNFINKLKESRIGLFSSELIKLENQRCIITNMVDITEYQNVKNSLLKSEYKYQTLFEKSADAIFIIHKATGRYIHANASAEKLTGYKVSDLAKLTTYDVTPKHAKQRLEIAKSIKSATEMGEITFIQPDGSRRLAQVTIVPLDTNTIYGIAQDITTRRKMEKQIQQSQKMESIGILAGGIAHDFNNILSAILGYAQLALTETPQNTSLEKNLQGVCNAGLRARDLVKQILMFARQSEDELTPIKVDTIIKEVLNFIRASLPATIDVQSDIKSKSRIMGNQTQLHQIIMNLCTNAAQAMDKNGGILSVRLKDKEIDCQTGEEFNLIPGKYIEISISDCGVGISPNTLDLIFEPYFTTKEPGQGTGLGLAIVHGIVESYGGKIFVESVLNEGSSFNIYIPTIQEIKNKTVYDTKNLPNGTERILFIDDEVSVAKTSGNCLQQLGYQLTIRTSSIKALELFKTKPNDFDLVITDMTMPFMTGKTLAIELMKIRPEIPVILCTGYSNKITKELAIDLGIKALVQKPIIMTDLAKIVRDILDDIR